MPIFVERASYSTRNWETIQVMSPWNEMRHIEDYSDPQESAKYVFGYSNKTTPILARVFGGIIEEMHIIEPNNSYVINVKRNPTSSTRQIRFRLVE